MSLRCLRPERSKASKFVPDYFSVKLAYRLKISNLSGPICTCWGRHCSRPWHMALNAVALPLAFSAVSARDFGQPSP